MKAIALTLLLLNPALLQAADADVARQYLKSRCRTLSKGASLADVEKVTALLSEDVVVEHPAAGAVVRGREAVTRGMASHLADYTGSAEESGIELLSLMEAPHAVAARTRVTFVVGEGAARQVVSREGLMVMEFRDGHIVRVIEY